MKACIGKSGGSMTVSASDPLLGSTEVPSRGKLVLMTIFSLPMAVIWSTMGLVVLPAEAIWLFPTDESFFLGIFLVVVGISQLICPVAGLLSDRHRSRWGRRRPFIILGTVVCCLGIVGMWVASLAREVIFFVFCLFWSQVALNVIYSVQASIVPDFYKERLGEASGIVAGLMFVGNLLGMLYVVWSAEEDFHFAYGTYLALLLMAAVVVACLVHEKPTDEDSREPVTWKSVVAAFYIDFNEHRDFVFVFVGRTCYYMSTSCQTFMYYYLRDLMSVRDEAVIKLRLAVLVIIAMVVGLLVSYPLGWVSDQYGRKPLVYVACGVMTMVYVGFVLSPLLGPELGMMAIYGLSAFYGMASGCYQSVDYALALDCLPDRQRSSEASEEAPPAPGKASSEKGSSEALGLWGISGFLGSAIGPLLGGLALEVLGGWGKGGHYTYPGYAVMLLMGAGSAALAGYFTTFIKGTK